MLDGRGRQKICQEEAQVPEPSPGPGHWPVFPFRYVCPQGHVQEKDQDHWDQGEDKSITLCYVGRYAFRFDYVLHLC